MDHPMLPSIFYCFLTSLVFDFHVAVHKRSALSYSPDQKKIVLFNC